MVQNRCELLAPQEPGNVLYRKQLYSSCSFSWKEINSRSASTFPMDGNLVATLKVYAVTLSTTKSRGSVWNERGHVNKTFFLPNPNSSHTFVTFGVYSIIGCKTVYCIYGLGNTVVKIHPDIVFLSQVILDRSSGGTPALNLQLLHPHEMNALLHVELQATFGPFTLNHLLCLPWTGKNFPQNSKNGWKVLKNNAPLSKKAIGLKRKKCCTLVSRPMP